MTSINLSRQVIFFFNLYFTRQNCSLENMRVLKSFIVMSSCNLSVFLKVFPAEGEECMKALFPNPVRVRGTEVDRKSRERILYDEFDLKVR